MMPRPASRKKPVAFVPPQELADEIERIRLRRGEPAAIVAGAREWRLCRSQTEARAHLQTWPGDDETFARVPIIIVRGFGAPKVMETQQDLEDALMGGPE